jgi:hypothetical protein
MQVSVSVKPRRHTSESVAAPGRIRRQCVLRPPHDLALRLAQRGQEAVARRELLTREVEADRVELEHTLAQITERREIVDDQDGPAFVVRTPPGGKGTVGSGSVLTDSRLTASST